MFRMMGARRGIFSSSRQFPLRINNFSRQEGPVNLQTVRIRRRVLRPTSIFIGAVTLFTCYSVLYRVVLKPLDKMADDFDKNLDETMKKELEEEELEPFFIPFPGTIRQKTPRPYRGSDPEWQEFIKFSKDPSLGKRVRDDLASIAKKVCEKSPAIILRCGKNIKVRRYWLDVDFPQNPPPEFERSGLEWTDNYIAWTTMPVDSKTVFRIRNVLWPSAVAQSSWSFSKVLFRQNMVKIAEMLGISTRKPQPSLEDLLANRKNRAVAGLVKPEDLAVLPRQRPPRRLPPPKKPEEADNNNNGDSIIAKGHSTHPENAGATTAADARLQMSLTRMKMHLLSAIIAFRVKLAQTWKPPIVYPPRGSIIVSGLIELDTPRAWLVVDVKAAWDPKEREFVHESMQLTLRRMQMKRQSPLGGQ